MLDDKTNKLKQQKIVSAIKIGICGMEQMLSKLKEGVLECDLSERFEKFVVSRGYLLSFPTIVAFGENTATVHHPTGKAVLEKGDLVMMDFGVKVDGYCSDMTRTFVFGKATKKQQKMLDAVWTAQQLAVDFIKTTLQRNEKISAREVDKISRDYLISQDYPSIPHNLGHGIGLEVHESPRISPKSEDFLEPGTIFSIEPGIYLPGFGGVRIEDLYTIEDHKIIQLTEYNLQLYA